MRASPLSNHRRLHPRHFLPAAAEHAGGGPVPPVPEAAAGGARAATDHQGLPGPLTAAALAAAGLCTSYFCTSPPPLQPLPPPQPRQHPPQLSWCHALQVYLDGSPSKLWLAPPQGLHCRLERRALQDRGPPSAASPSPGLGVEPRPSTSPGEGAAVLLSPSLHSSWSGLSSALQTLPAFRRLPSGSS